MAFIPLSQLFSELPVYEKILPALLHYGIFSLSSHCHMTPGIPIKPMLAHPTKALSEVLDRFERLPFTCEYKYDGERAQIHCTDDGKIFVASRNLENMSEKYPDISNKMNIVQRDPSVQSFVLDCEAVAWDAEEKKILPFQVLSTRKRKASRF
jgi:DNA ligase 1